VITGSRLPGRRVQAYAVVRHWAPLPGKFGSGADLVSSWQAARRGNDPPPRHAAALKGQHTGYLPWTAPVQCFPDLLGDRAIRHDPTRWYSRDKVEHRLRVLFVHSPSS
jgi:hypothetical protein